MRMLISLVLEVSIKSDPNSGTPFVSVMKVSMLRLRFLFSLKM